MLFRSGAPATLDESEGNKEFSVSELNFAGIKKVVYQKKKIKKKDSHTKNQLEAIVDYIAEYCEEKGIRRLSNICMPPLPELLTYENGERLDSEEIYAYIGLLDDPDRQSQEKLKINITAQNYILIGSAQCGKTNVLQTIIRSLAENYTPAEVNLYIIDFGSMILRNFAELHHCGGVVCVSDDEKLKNLFKLLQTETAKRKEILARSGVSSFVAYKEAGYHDLPQIVVIIDNLTALKEMYLQDQDYLLPLCRDGIAVGISFIVANVQTSGIGYRYLNNFEGRIALFCNEILGYVGNYVCNFIYSRKFVNYNSKEKLQVRQHLKAVLILFASILAINIYTNVDTVMLGFINDDRSVGLYDIACKGKLVLLSLINAISTVLFPRLSYYLAENDICSYNKVLKKSISTIMGIAIPLSMFFIIEAKDVVIFLGGYDYEDAALCMQILMPILIISGFSNITGNQILLPHGKDISYMKAVISGAIVDVVLNLVFMPKYSLYGAAFATLMAEIVQMLLQLWQAKKFLESNIDFLELLKITIACIVATTVTYILRIINSFSVIVNLIFGFIFYIIVYLFMLKIFRTKVVCELSEKVEPKCKK